MATAPISPRVFDETGTKLMQTNAKGHFTPGTVSFKQLSTMRRIFLLAWRGWTKSCPKCGNRGIFQRWFTLRHSCPSCGFVFEREEGYWTGAMGANIIATELVFVAGLITALVITWPSPPLRELIIGAVLFNIVFPMFFYPFSKTIWMGFDLAFHPPDDS
jgi:uncharacterized protein (DUF983 family)